MKDITGQTFGRLTALYPTGERNAYGRTIWHMRCSCGNEIDVAQNLLTLGHKMSCGCIPRKGFDRKDLTGQKFGKLTALYDTGEVDKYGAVLWKCRCDCGKEVIVPSVRLSSGNTSSCGCLRKNPVEVGQVYGRLTVMELLPGGCAKVRCECGTEKVVKKDALARGATKSCGCLRKEPRGRGLRIPKRPRL